MANEKRFGGSTAWLEPSRMAARRRAEAWTLAQAERLMVAPSVIEDATARGWFSEDIEACRNHHALTLAPRSKLTDFAENVRTGKWINGD